MTEFSGVPAYTPNSRHTRRNYQRQGQAFLAFVARPLAQVRVIDVQGYLESLQGSAPGTQALAAAAIKSLLTFAYETGYLPFNPGVAVKLPPVKRTLAERILSEGEVQWLIHLEPDPRNRMALSLLVTNRTYPQLEPQSSQFFDHIN